MRDEDKSKQELISELKELRLRLSGDENHQAGIDHAFWAIHDLIFSSLEFDQIMKRVVVEAARAVGAHSASIGLFEEGAFRIKYLHNFPQELLGLRFDPRHVKVIGITARTMQPLVIDDAFQNEEVDPMFVRRFGIRSFLTVPLVRQGETVGILFCNNHSRKSAFSAAAVEFGRRLAASLSVAVENVRLFEANRKAQEQVRSELEISSHLLAATEALLSPMDRRETLEALVEVIGKATGRTRIIIGLVSRNKGEIKVTACRGTKISHPGMVFRVEDVAPLMLNALEGKTTVVADYEADLPFEIRDRAASYDIRLALLVPLVVEEEVIGLISVDDPGVRREFDSREIKLIEGIARQAAVAIENAELYEDRQRAEEQLWDLNVKLSEVLESITDAYIVLDAEWRFTEVNPVAASEVFKRPAHELKGKVIWEEFPETVEGESYRQCQIAVAEGHPVHFEALSRLNEKWYEVHAYPRKGHLEIYFRDITPRKQIKEELKRSAERVAATLESISDAFFALDREWRFTYVNAEAERLMNRERMSLLGKVLWDEFPEAMGSAFNHEYLRAITEKETAGFVEYYPPLAKWFEVRAYPFQEGLSVYFRDVSERIKAEEALKKSEEKYRELVRDAGSIILKTDTAGNITFINEFAQRFFGYEEDELIGKSVIGTIIPATDSSGKDLAAMVADIIRDAEKYRRNENENIRKNGEKAWISWTNRSIRDQKGKVVGFLGIGHDITDQKRAEEALKESEERFRLLAEHARDIVYRYEILPERRFAYVSPAVAELSGYTPVDHYADPDLWLKLVHPDDRHLLQLGGKADNQLVTLRWVKKDGSIIWTEHHNSASRNHAGQVTAVQGIVRDITERKQLDRKLAHLASFPELNPNPVLEANLDGEISYANPASLEAIPAVESMKNIRELFPDWDQAVEDLQRAENHTIAREMTVGGATYLQSLRLISESEVVRIYVMDVTEAHRRSKEAEEGRRILEAIMEYVPEGITVADAPDVKIRMVSRYGRELTGRKREEIENITAEEHPEKWQLFHSDRVTPAAPEELPLTRATKQGEEVHNEEWVLKRPDGKEVTVLCNAGPIKNGEGAITGGIITWRDITERKQMEEAVWHQAYHDMLTGLPNKMLFMDHLNLEIAQAGRHRARLGVMFLDLDRFKNINDTMGHAVGDDLLRQVAGRLQSCIRESDNVGRIGGDEFTILLNEINSPGDAGRIAEKIIQAFREPYLLGDQELVVSTSIGISIYPDDGQHPDILLKHADIAMYHAKGEGRNNFQFYNPAMNIRTLERMILENSLRQTLEKGQLEVHYQPQVDLKSRRVISAEALVRWRHPDLGLLNPLQFIPLAEEMGFIIPIDEWVLRNACLQNKAWQDAGLPRLNITVNISARQFQRPDLVQAVSQILRETGLDPRYLELEITEGTAMRDIDHSVPTLRALNELGVKFSIDDFGTGYSSLNYLKKLPIQKLKIDRSFISDIPGDPEGQVIVNAVINLAHNLKLKVVAEGVETEEQLKFLLANGCDGIQGYLSGKPLTADDFHSALKGNH